MPVLLFGLTLMGSAGFLTGLTGYAIAQTQAQPQAQSQSAREAETAKQQDALDELFGQLKTADTPNQFREIEEAILQTWLMSGSDTVDLLMARAINAMQDQNYPIALDLLDAVIALKPDYAEGWNKRATVYFLVQDPQRSIADIQKVLALEPRHFGALSGLGLIMRELGDNERALYAFRQALDVHPGLRAAQDAVADLEKVVEGEDL
ncbi:tetratricopeptide repeat protein [Coralliovum pocilloporae]|uniref:tetratricopeptide repeat protein n=1 Tax=Coralliovum pocilloporae TaxID=3066369 RepID=UPI003307AA23